MDTNQFIENLTNELQKNLDKSSKEPSNSIVGSSLVMFIILIIVTILLFCFSTKSLFDFILTVFLMCIFSTLTFLWIKLQREYQIENQQNNRAWQTKLIDAYGNLLEKQIKLANNEVENQIKVANKETELKIKKMEEK